MDAADAKLSPGLEETLEIAKVGLPGSKWNVPNEQADELIAKLGLEMEETQSSMGEEVTTTFEYEGELMCLELRWNGGFSVYTPR